MQNLKTFLISLLLTLAMTAGGWLAGCAAVKAGARAFERELPHQAGKLDVPGAVERTKADAEQHGSDWQEYLGGALGAAAAAGLGVFLRRKQIAAQGALTVLVPAIDNFANTNPDNHELLLDEIRELRPEGKDRQLFETVIDRTRRRVLSGQVSG